MSQIKSAIRLISIVAAAGMPPPLFPFIPVIEKNLDILRNQYFPTIYPIHEIETNGFLTIHPLDNGVVDDVKELNYFKLMRKIYKKAQKVVDYSNSTDILVTEYLYDKDIRFFSSNAKGTFGKIFLNSLELTDKNIANVVDRHETMFYVIAGIIGVFMIYIITQIIIPNTNKSYKFIKDIVCLYKTLPSKFFHEQSNDYIDQIQQICENYDAEDEGIGKKGKQSKSTSTKKVKLLFIFYCFLVTIFLLFPFLTVFLYKSECKSLIKFLVYSTKRAYYLSSVNLYDMEIIINDRYYYSEGEELALLNEMYSKLQKLENELKNGVYGGKSSSEYSIFKHLSNNPGCVRSKEECDERTFDEFYTKELSESPIDYLMVEYLNKLSEFINNPPVHHYDLRNVDDLVSIIYDIAGSLHIQLFKKLSDDIIAHINAMNDIGTKSLLNDAVTYIQITLLAHALCSILIFITFYIFVSRPIKKQLRVIDSLTNITFSIPSSIYNSSSKVKNFIENGKLED